MTVLDRIPGDSVESGDIIRYDGQDWEILYLDSDESDMVCFRAYNRDTGDEDTVILDPADYYDVLDEDFDA
jgi:hypothetical protein